MTRARSRSLPEEYLRKPVIPYLTATAVEFSSLAHASLVMLQADELAELPEILTMFERAPLKDMPLFLHLDLIRGLARDESGLQFLARFKRINGVITVHHHLVPAIHRLGMYSVVRLFLQDGRAVKRGLSVLEKSKPDAVELLPGVAAAEVGADFDCLPTPRIAGGLIRGPETMRHILASGCRAVSTTNQKLWALNAH